MIVAYERLTSEFTPLSLAQIKLCKEGTPLLNLSGQYLPLLIIANDINLSKSLSMNAPVDQECLDKSIHVPQWHDLQTY